MTHFCTVCSSEFEDDSITPANADFVHCVFCGSKIPLARRASARAATSVVPFSKDYEREEAFALGVINPSGPGFPDTLRQFRVPAEHARPDSLSPLAHGSEAPGALPARAPRRLASLSLSLSVGFGVGVALAFAAVSLRPSAAARRAGAVSSSLAATRPSPASRLAAPPPTKPAPAPAEPAALPTAALDPPARATLPAPIGVVAGKPPSAEQNRRWLLDRARAEQRQYHLSAAEQLYRQLLARAPRDSEALSGLGELDLLRGTVDLASAHFQQALDANANYVPALIASADLQWQAGRTDEARQAYLDIVEHYSPDLYPPYVALRSTTTATPPCER